MTSDQLIREAAVSGRLVGLTIWKIQDGRYQVSISPDRVSWRVEIDADPVAAVQRLLVEKPKPVGDIFG